MSKHWKYTCINSSRYDKIYYFLFEIFLLFPAVILNHWSSRCGKAIDLILMFLFSGSSQLYKREREIILERKRETNRGEIIHVHKKKKIILKQLHCKLKAQEEKTIFWLKNNKRGVFICIYWWLCVKEKKEVKVKLIRGLLEYV